MKKETFEAQKAFAGKKKPSMLRRCVGHDYAAIGAAQARKKETPEGYVLDETFKKAHRDELSVKSLDEIARRCGWESHKSLRRIAHKFGVSFRR